MAGCSWPTGGPSPAESAVPLRYSRPRASQWLRRARFRSGGRGATKPPFPCSWTTTSYVCVRRARPARQTRWTWSEDRGGLQQFLGEIHRHVTHGSPMSLTGWQSLMRWAERRAGRSARQSGSAAAEEPTLSGKAPPRAVLPGTSQEAHAARAASPARGAADRGGKQGAEEAAPALALPAKGRSPLEKGIAHAALRAHRVAGHGGDEEGAHACRAQPVGGGGPVVNPIQASSTDVPGSAGSAADRGGEQGAEEAARERSESHKRGHCPRRAAGAPRRRPRGG